VKFQATFIGINETADHNPFRVYPNPSKGDIKISSQPGLLNRPFTISDIAGQIVFSGITTEEEQTVPMGSLGSGCYFIRIDDQNMIRVIRYRDYGKPFFQLFQFFALNL
jgi:hypothetical protein